MAEHGKSGLMAADMLLRVIAAVVLFAMMALTLVDVIMRYGFNASIRGAFEITELLLVVLIFSGLPLVSHTDQHVVVDLLRFPGWANKVLAVASQAACAFILGGISWLLWRKSLRVLADNDVTSALLIPILPFIYLMGALTIAATLIHLWKFVALVRGRGPTEATINSQTL